jgi:hypothetical protein
MLLNVSHAVTLLFTLPLYTGPTGRLHILNNDYTFGITDKKKKLVLQTTYKDGHLEKLEE